MLNSRGKSIALWLIIGLFLVAVFNLYNGTSTKQIPSVDYSEFVTQVENGQVADAFIRGDHVMGRFVDGRTFTTYLPPQDPSVIQNLVKHHARVKIGPPEEATPSFFQILLSWFPMLLLVGVWVFFLRQMQSGTGRAMGFGKSRARLLDEKTNKVTFEDVAGIEEAKEDLEEIVEFLRNPPKFQKLGGKIPKGVLLIGPPGTGKTLLARAIAGEANVPFFSISGSDFVEMFVGVGASRVRDMFEQAKQTAPCIIFIDEVDAVGRHRGAGLGGGNDEREQTLNQLLVEMDGFESSEGVILIAATNRPDVLDPALLRPGRFDRQVVVPNPDVLGREKILLVHMKKVVLAPDVDPKVIARGTPGFSGADLANLVNEGALLAARRNKRAVSMRELEDAKDKVIMGAERRSIVMTEEEKRLTAYHEGGHAVVAFYSAASDPIHKATIIPRGRALGMVIRLPEGDRVSMPRSKLMADLAVAMGGRIAEDLIFGADQITTGASSDIKMATDIARRMVTEWGMSERLGPVTYGDVAQEVFVGHTIAQHKTVSEATSQEIDKEIRLIVDTAYSTAQGILKKYLSELHLIANQLLEHETLSGEDIRCLIETGKMNRKPSEENTVRKTSLDPQWDEPSEAPPSPAQKKPRKPTAPKPTRKILKPSETEG
ncbi:MAG: ATP-dependent zinc metalloprotease FtsH [Holosporales bacterium]